MDCHNQQNSRTTQSSATPGYRAFCIFTWKRQNDTEEKEKQENGAEKSGKERANSPGPSILLSKDPLLNLNSSCVVAVQFDAKS